MFKKIKQLVGDSLIYGVSGIITRFISIFLIPVYTRIFNPSDYGIINLVNTTFLLIGIFVVLGLDNSVAIWYWDKEDDAERRKTFSTWFWIQFLLSLFVLFLFATSSGLLSHLILGNKDLNYLLILAALNLPLTTFTLVFGTWLRIKRKAKATVLFSLFNSLMTIGLSIYFVVFARIGLKGVFLAQLISNAVCSILVIGAMGKTLSPAYFGFTRMKEMLRYSGPLIPATISFWLMNYAGAYFISHFTNKTEVGLYQIGSSIAAVCNIVFWAFLQAWSPFAMSIHKQEDAPGIYSLVFDLYCVVGSILVLSVFLFAPELLKAFTTSAYSNAALVAGILSVNIFISNITQITSLGSAIVKTNVPYVIGVFWGSALSVGLYFIMIPWLGKEGAALGTLAGSVVLTVYVTYRSQLLYFIPYHLGKNIYLIIAMIVAIIFSLLVYKGSYLATFAMKLGLLFLFIGYGIFLNRVSIIKLKKQIFLNPSRVE